MAEDGGTPFVAPAGSSALFLDESVVQEGLDADESNIDLAAMKALMEETPEETAEILKEQGNLALKKGKKLYLEAFKYYSQAIALKGSNSTNNSIYHSNRAHVSLLLNNWGRAIKDCERAIHLYPQNVKAHFRAAKAAAALGNYEGALGYCSGGLEYDRDNKELQQIADKARKKVDEKQAQLKQAKDRKAGVEAIADALAARHVAVGTAEYRTHIGGRKAQLDSEGVLHWPCLIIYPEAMAVDIIEDFCETDRFEEHLDQMVQMFGDGAAPLDWDEKGVYKREAVELYYQTHATGALSRDQLVEELLRGLDGAEEEDMPPKDWSARRWKKVKLGATLGEVVSQPGHVLLGVPVFYVVAKNTEFRDRFLSGAWSPP